MKCFLLVLSLILHGSLSFAQKEIRGHVINRNTHQPVENVMVTAHSTRSKSILAYTVTLADGTFTLKSANFPDTIDITVNSMTIKSQTKRVQSNMDFVEFSVKEETVTLKEVKVNAPKIRQKGDTINYMVSSFTNETDRSIGDVLKRLPGIQVLSSGKILYQNKPISKLYIEDLDLLQGKYGIATNNIEASKVASVQVLENHQPLKILKNAELPETAAINLKLKKSGLGAFFLTAQLGTGLPVVLLNNEVVSMRFTRSQQNLLMYKGDNTGRDIVKEMASFYHAPSNSDLQFFNLEKPSLPRINEQHYLFNDAHIASLNDLRTLKKDYILTTNLNFLHDRQKRNTIYRRDILLNSQEPVRIDEEMRARLMKRELNGTLTLERNQDDFYLNNRLDFFSKWNMESSDISADMPILQKQRMPSARIENTFRHLQKKDGRTKRFNSNISYTTQQHTLNVFPVLFKNLNVLDSTAQQNLSFKQFESDFYYQEYRKLNRKWDLNYQAGVFFNHYSLASEMYHDKKTPITVDSLTNKLRRNEYGINGTLMLFYRYSSNFKLGFQTPVRLMNLDRHDWIRDTQQNRWYLFVHPKMYFDYTRKRYGFRLNMSHTKNISTIREDMLGYILSSYRSMNRNDAVVSENRMTTADLLVTYKNPFTTLFASANLSYSFTKRNTLYDIVYTGMLNTTTNIHHPNTAHTCNAKTSLGKEIPALRSTVKLTGNYSHNQSVALYQGLISDYRLETFSLSPNIQTDLNFIIFKYNASYRYNKNKINNERKASIHYLKQEFSASVIPTKGLLFHLSFNHYHNSRITSSARSMWFGNIGVRYKHKRAEWRLDWTNIFNTKQFVAYSYNDVSSYYSAYKLRPSEILLKVRFTVF